jgi:hypothetical protein
MFFATEVAKTAAFLMSDSVPGDAVLRTASNAHRILIGNGTDVVSSLTVSSNLVTVGHASHAVDATVYGVLCAQDLQSRAGQNAINIGCDAGTTVVNVGGGASGATTINLGGPGDTLNLGGALSHIVTTDLQVQDKLLTINRHGAAASATGTGIEIEEAGAIVGYIKTTPDRGGYLLRAPASVGDLTLDLTSEAANFNAGWLCLSNGRVGVQTATPQTTLDVVGQVWGRYDGDDADAGRGALTVYNAARSRALTLGTAVAASNYAYVQAHDAGSTGATTPLVLNRNGGNVGIGTSNVPYTLTVAGSVNATEVTMLSDRRLKSDLRVIEGALDRVRALTGYTFRMAAQEERSTGLVAQDVLRVLPEAVSVDDFTSHMSVSYGSMMGLVVQAIKELDAAVSDIRAALP